MFPHNYDLQQEHLRCGSFLQHKEFSEKSQMKRKTIENCHSLTFSQTETTKSQPPYIENLHTQDNTITTIQTPKIQKHKNRAAVICCNKEDLKNEHQQINSTLKNNGYPNNILTRKNRSKPNNCHSPEEKPKGTAIVLYALGT